MYIYAFGSICRGEIDIHSDIDLLAICDEPSQFSRNLYSIYTEEKIKSLWGKGNPFAWHLYWESKIIFSAQGNDFLASLGKPAQYKNGLKDSLEFYNIFLDAYASLITEKTSFVYDASMVFLAIRNIASCYSLEILDKPNFSRNSALNLDEVNVPISNKIYKLLEQARILTTRGSGESMMPEDITEILPSLPKVCDWMEYLIDDIREKYE